MTKKLTAEELYPLALDKRCVSIPSIMAKRMPVAFLIGMPFRLVMNYIHQGVYLYEPKKKKINYDMLDHGAY